MPNSNNPPVNKPAPYTLMQLYKDLGALMCDTPAAADIALGCECFMAYIASSQANDVEAAMLLSVQQNLHNIGTQLIKSTDYADELFAECEVSSVLEFLHVGGVH